MKNPKKSYHNPTPRLCARALFVFVCSVKWNEQELEAQELDRACKTPPRPIDEPKTPWAGPVKTSAEEIPELSLQSDSEQASTSSCCTSSSQSTTGWTTSDSEAEEEEERHQAEFREHRRDHYRNEAARPDK